VRRGFTMINLGRSVSEYEEQNIKYFFEIPPNYEEIISQEKWLIIGRKGSGKSTIIDYRTTNNHDTINICIRPGRKLTNIVLSVYNKVVHNVKTSDGIEQDHLEEEIALRMSSILHFLVHTEAMKSVVKDKENELLTDNSATIYNFLRNNKLIGGSTIFKSIKFIKTVTKGFKYIDNLSNVLDDCSDPTFEDAVDATYELLKDSQISVFVYIDNIDDYGFDYSVRNRAFFNALITCTMQINNDCLREKVPFRVILTIPTELFENTKQWNRDKIGDRSVYLRWNNEEKIRNLLSKRIAIELNVRKNKPRYTDDVFSISWDKTWEKIFPITISNKFDRSEETFIYLLRHTLYTPRTILNICSSILNHKVESGLSLDDSTGIDTSRYKNAIPQIVEEASIETSKSIIEIYDKMFNNIKKLLFKFKGRPNIWMLNSFEQFINSECIEVVSDRAKGFFLNDYITVSELLYKIGFIGFGYNTNIAPAGCEQYSLNFSYINSSRNNNACDIIVISPIFYDYIGIDPDEHSTIVPNKDLLLNPKTLKLIRSYNVIYNFQRK
jgi:hypothetical protein